MTACTKGSVAYFLTVDWYFCHHYLDLACAVRNAGYQVTVITSAGEQAERIRAAGLQLVPIRISRRGMQPLRELGTLFNLARSLRRVRPDLLHNIAQKPVLYGTLTAWLTGVPAVVNGVAGMGHLFTAGTKRAQLMGGILMLAYRVLLNRPRVAVTVQNPDDREQLRRLARVEPTLIPGSGVDLARFRPSPKRAPPINVVLASRLLWDKGIGEFVAAAELLRAQSRDVHCVLVGKPDPGNPATVDEQQLAAWHARGVIDWWGHREDMPWVLAQTHIACLPSYYREGIPKFLIEAAASGLPLVTCDVPGCREAVEQDGNGLLVPPKDPVALAQALARLAAEPELRARMGRRSRAMAEARFGREDICAATLKVYERLLAGKHAHRLGSVPASRER